MEKKPDQFQYFKNYMSHKGQWVKKSETATTVTYEKYIPPSKGSCLIALCLIPFAVLPAFLYLYYANKPAKTETISVEVLSDGTLRGNGTPGGLRVYHAFVAIRAVKDRNKV